MIGATTAAVVGKATGDWISADRNKKKEAEATAAEIATQGRLDDVFEAMRPQISPIEAAAQVARSSGKIQTWLETDGTVVVDLDGAETVTRAKTQWDLLEALTAIGAPHEQSSGTYRTGNDPEGTSVHTTVDTRVMDPNAAPAVLRAPIVETHLTYRDQYPDPYINIDTSRKAGVYKPDALRWPNIMRRDDGRYPVNKEQNVTVTFPLDGSTIAVELTATGGSYDTFQEVPYGTDFTMQLSVDGKPVEDSAQQAGLLGQLPNAINAVAARLDDHIEAGGEW